MLNKGQKKVPFPLTTNRGRICQKVLLDGALIIFIFCTKLNILRSEEVYNISVESDVTYNKEGSFLDTM